MSALVELRAAGGEPVGESALQGSVFKVPSLAVLEVYPPSV